MQTIEKSLSNFKAKLFKTFTVFYEHNPDTFFSRDRLQVYLRELMYKYCPQDDYAYAERCILDLLKTK